MKLSLVILCIVAGFAASPREACAQPFWNLPLTPGQQAAYVYSGEVTWMEGNEVVSDSIVWTMRILESVSRRNIRAWKVAGHPMDLAWYRPGMKPVIRTLIEVAGKSYYLTSESAFARVRDEEDKLTELVWESELILELPLSKGRAFGEAQKPPRADGMYMWRVEDIQSVSLRSSGGEDFLYTVVYRANNFVILTEWRKGAGLVRYRYRHHGASTDCDVRLERQPAGLRVDNE